jgi:hypothetical protein
MRRNLLSLIAVSIAAVMSFVSAAAQVEPGSAGGVLGKQNKSASGGEDTPVTTREKTKFREAHAKSLCAKIPGVWSWWVNGNVTFSSNGKVAQPQSNLSGTWSCSGDHVVVLWSHGYTDRLTLAPEGTHLSGTNGFMSVTADRL